MNTEIKPEEVRIGISAIAGGEEIGVSYTVMQLWLSGKVKLYGIAITEERLIALGFEDKRDIKVFSKGKYDVERLLTDSPLWEFCIDEQQTGTSVKYIHQLQNLYYDLTQTDLSIQSKTEQ